MSNGCWGSRGCSIALITPPSDVDYAGAIATHLEQNAPNAQLNRFDPTTDHLPEPGGPDLVIVTGSTARVTHETRWIDDLATHLRALLSSGTSVLGVCFGHQLLASALGGQVSSLPVRAAGFREISTTEHGQPHPLFSGVPDTFTAFRWHRDHVTSLPPDAVPLAHAADATIQSFACPDRPAMGIQYHPEVGLQDARVLVGGHPASRLPEDTRDTLTDAAALRASRARRLYENAVWAVTHQNSTV